MADKIHVGDTMLFRSTIVNSYDDSTVDISGASTRNFIFQDPNGATLTVQGSFLTDGTDGIIQYKALPTDLNQPGLWRYQIFLVIGNNENYTDITKFRVFQNLPLV